MAVYVISWLDRHPHVQPIAVAHQFPDWMLDAADIRIPPIPVPAGPPRDDGPPAPPEKTGPLADRVQYAQSGLCLRGVGRSAGIPENTETGYVIVSGDGHRKVEVVK